MCVLQHSACRTHLLEKEQMEQDAALRQQTARVRGLGMESYPHCPLRGLRPRELPSLATPQLAANETLDSAALSFLLNRAFEEEEEQKKAKEALSAWHARPKVVSAARCRRPTHASKPPSLPKRRKRKKKRRRRRRTTSWGLGVFCGALAWDSCSVSQISAVLGPTADTCSHVSHGVFLVPLYSAVIFLMRRAAEEYKLVFFWVMTSFASVIGVSLRVYWKVPREPSVPGSHLFGVFREDRAGKFDFSVSQCRARVDNGSCMHWTGFLGDDALRAVFPSIVLRPSMDQKDGCLEEYRKIGFDCEMTSLCFRVQRSFWYVVHDMRRQSTEWRSFTFFTWKTWTSGS